ncbi:MAG: hypothetical protein WEB13_06980 [Dehalococcoidia bacterium]
MRYVVYGAGAIGGGIGAAHAEGVPCLGAALPLDLGARLGMRSLEERIYFSTSMPAAWRMAVMRV